MEEKGMAEIGMKEKGLEENEVPSARGGLGQKR